MKKDYDWFTKGELAKEELGNDSFWTVGPGGARLHIADPDILADITNRSKEFPKFLYGYDVLEIFGKNVLTSEGHEWAVHRKITAPPFNERNNS